MGINCDSVTSSHEVNKEDFLDFSDQTPAQSLLRYIIAFDLNKSERLSKISRTSLQKKKVKDLREMKNSGRLTNLGLSQDVNDHI